MGETNHKAIINHEYQREQTPLQKVNSGVHSLLNQRLPLEEYENLESETHLEKMQIEILKNNLHSALKKYENHNPANNLFEILEAPKLLYKSSKVLLLADNIEMLKFLSDPLQENYSVFICNNVNDAYETIMTLKPDIIISDTVVSEMDIIDFCRIIKEDYEFRKIPFVLVSGHRNKYQERIRGFDAGADEFLSRPFNQRELVARINSLLRMRNLYETIGSFESVIYSLANAVEAKDEYTNGHCQRLMDVAELIAEKVGLSSYQISVIRHGAILHDIGKIGIPEQILNKPDALTDEEFNVIKAHPMIGVKICKPLSNIENFLPIIRNHHERIDGKGYPDGLSGDEIPVEVKIVSVADAFDAIYSDRPYRKGKSLDETLLYFSQNKNMGQWDPDIVKILDNINLKGLELKWQKLINTL